MEFALPMPFLPPSPSMKHPILLALLLAAAVSVIAVAAILAIMLAASLLARRLPPGVLPWQA